MTRMVRRLEDLKLARRKAFPSDGRVAHVVYTSGTIRILEKGKAQRVRALVGHQSSDIPSSNEHC